MIFKVEYYSFKARSHLCVAKHINALLRCSLVITAVVLLRSLLRSRLIEL